MEAQKPVAVCAVLRGIIIQDQGRRILGPLITDERLQHVAIPCFLPGDDPAGSIFAFDIASGLIEEICIALGIPRRVPVMQLDFIEGVVSK